MNKKCCGNCKFYSKDTERHFGLVSDEPLHQGDYESECLRYPPTRGEPAYYGELSECDVHRDCFHQPIVNILAWCGEFKDA